MIESRGIAEQVARMRAIVARMRDLSPVLEVVASDTTAVIDDSFARAQAPDDMAWLPLSPRTIAGRRRGRGRGQPQPLQDTGRLRASSGARVDGHGVIFGTAVGYGRYQHLGTSRIVARPFLPVEGEPGSFVLTSTGRGGAHWTRSKAAIKAYILTGAL